ncbi:MAG: hypothetical protein RLZZ450_2621 [Pseudomonadota bacterium]
MRPSAYQQSVRRYLASKRAADISADVAERLWTLGKGIQAGSLDRVHYLRSIVEWQLEDGSPWPLTHVRQLARDEGLAPFPASLRKQAHGRSPRLHARCAA